MQTKLFDLSTGLEKVCRADQAMLYNPQTGYKKLVEVVKKSRTQVTIEGERKYNILTGCIVPQDSNYSYFLRALTSEEIDNIDILIMRESIIVEIKEKLHSLDLDTLIKINQMIC